MFKTLMFNNKILCETLKQRQKDKLDNTVNVMYNVYV